MSTRSICGVILAARDPQALAGFYAEVLEVEFEREDHGGLEIHYGVDIGEIHFGIHPPANLGLDRAGRGTASLAFNVDSLEAVAARLAALGAEQIAAPHDEGFGPTARYLDPEGNPFEVVELSYTFGE